MNNPPNEPRAVLATCIGSGRRRVQVLLLAEAKARAIELLNATVSDDCMINLHPMSPELQDAQTAFSKKEP